MYKYHTLEALKNELRSYNSLRKELKYTNNNYHKPLDDLQDRYEFLEEKLKTIKSPGRGDGLGGFVQENDEKYNDLIVKMNKVAKEMEDYIKENKDEYIRNAIMLKKRILTIEHYVNQINGCDKKGFSNKQFISDFFFNLSKKDCMENYKIENTNSLYRKADNILEKILKK